MFLYYYILPWSWLGFFFKKKELLLYLLKLKYFNSRLASNYTGPTHKKWIIQNILNQNTSKLKHNVETIIIYTNEK